MRSHANAFVALLIAGFAVAANGEGRSIAVFVALCDNEHQGIVPVPARIGNGDDPEGNLYWGCGEGLAGCFDRSPKWNLVENVDEASGDVLRKRTYSHLGDQARLYARAYRGRAIQQCTQDFEDAIRTGDYDLVVYIGHNGLMDFDLPLPEQSSPPKKKPDCIVLCCMSETYFQSRIQLLGARPILLTTQFMYPGSFILHDVLEKWLENADLKAIRECAGRSYARNQKISDKAGRGVFSILGTP